MDRSPQALVRIAPGDGERVEGGLALAWEARSGALAYRVVVLEPGSGQLLAVDAGTAARVDIPARTMTEAFGGRGTHDLWWTVAMRRLDGEERVSAPGRVAWSAGGP